MKLSVKGVGIVFGIMWSLFVFWAILMELVGIGSTPYNFMDQMYLGWLAPTVGGAILGLVFGFCDGLISGAIFAWLYNKIVK
jgi:hypothetical protein